jgi:hypothetical protein
MRRVDSKQGIIGQGTCPFGPLRNGDDELVIDEF